MFPSCLSHERFHITELTSRLSSAFRCSFPRVLLIDYNRHACFVILFQCLLNLVYKFLRNLSFSLNRHSSRCAFLSSNLYLVKSLMNFWHTLHFCLNLPFSYHNRHLSRFASLSPHLSVWQAFDGFLPMQLPTFSNLPFS